MSNEWALYQALTFETYCCESQLHPRSGSSAVFRKPGSKRWSNSKMKQPSISGKHHIRGSSHTSGLKESYFEIADLFSSLKKLMSLP